MGITSDELSGLRTDTQGQAEDKGTPSPAPADNLHQNPNFQALQSKYQKQINEAQAEAARNAREKERALAERDALLNAVRTADPDAASVLLKDAELAALRADKERRDREELERAEAIENEQNWNAYHDNLAREMGLDPYARELAEAKMQAVAVGNDNPLSVARQALLNKKYQAAAPQQQEQTDRDDYALPPSGGNPNAGKRDAETIDGELLDLLDEPTKNAARIAALRKEKKQITGR